MDIVFYVQIQAALENSKFIYSYFYWTLKNSPSNIISLQTYRSNVVNMYESR